MAGDKQLFGPLPLRAMADDLSGLDLRALLCVASHDRMSLVTGKGQGCRASNERMSQMIGCSYARLCTTLTKLTAGGYLQQEKLGRHTIYRVIYTDNDRLLFGNVSGRSIGCRSVAETGVTGCQHSPETGEVLPETSSQYIPLNGVRDSVETGKDNSVETAHLAVRRLAKIEFGDNVGAQLAWLERMLDAGAPIDAAAWLQWLEDIPLTDENSSNSGRAARLSERVIEAMSEEEYRDSSCGGSCCCLSRMRAVPFAVVINPAVLQTPLSVARFRDAGRLPWRKRRWKSAVHRTQAAPLAAADFQHQP
jgi:hypothetical protein